MVATTKYNRRNHLLAGRFTVLLEPWALDELKKMAGENGLTRAEYARDILMDAIQRHKRKRVQPVPDEAVTA